MINTAADLWGMPGGALGPSEDVRQVEDDAGGGGLAAVGGPVALNGGGATIDRLATESVRFIGPVFPISNGFHGLKEVLMVTAVSGFSGTLSTGDVRSRPLWVCVSGDHLVARFIEPLAAQPSGGALPWFTVDGGHTWSLSMGIGVGDFLRGDLGGSTPPLLLAVADGLLIDFEVAGSVVLSGDERGVAAVIESIGTQLAERPGGPSIDTEALCKAEMAQTAGGAGGEGGVVLTVTSASASAADPPTRRGGLRLVADRSTVRFGRSTVRLGPNPDRSIHRPGRPICSTDRPHGPELRLLGPIEAVGFGRSDAGLGGTSQQPKLSSQQLSLLSYLACAGPVSGSAVIEALWSGQAISASRFPNLLAEVRSRIGHHYLPRSEGGRYRLRGVGTDLERFDAEVGPGSRHHDRPTAELIAAMELIRGVPLASPGGRYWSWVDGHAMLAAIEASVSEGARWVAAVCRRRGELEAAHIACLRGLLACPYDEELAVCLVEVLVAMGRLGEAVRQVERWEARIRSLDCGEPPCGPRAALRAARRSSSASCAPETQERLSARMSTGRLQRPM